MKRLLRVSYAQRVLPALACLLLATGAMATIKTTQHGDVFYEVDEDAGYAYATGIADESATDITIASHVNVTFDDGLSYYSYPVTYISARAFYYNDSLLSVTIEDGITQILESAFQACSSLTSVTLPATLDSIGKNAFSNCVALDNLTIPGSLRGWGEGAFQYCSGLKNLTLEEGLESIGYRAFFFCENLSSVTIPSTVKTIRSSAFSGRYNSLETLKSIIVKGPADIAGGAFSYQKGLTCVTMDCGVSTHESSFSDCSNLDTLLVTGTDGWVTNGFVGLKSKVNTVIISDGVTCIGDSAFCGFYLTCLVVPSSVKSIGDYAFYGNYLTSVKIPSGVETVGALAYGKSSKLTAVSIGSNVKSLGTGAFYYCTSLTSVSIAEGVERIGDDCFGHCSKLTSVALPASVTELGEHVFDACTNLLEIAVDSCNPAYVSIDSVLFDKAQTRLIRYPQAKSGFLSLPGTLTDVASRACSSCTKLTGVDFPDGLVTVGDSAFYDCTAMTSGTLPVSVESVELSAFQDCINLVAEVDLPNVTYLGPYAFYNCRGLTSVSLGGGLSSIGEYAFYTGYSCSLASITLSEGLESIGKYAFYSSLNTSVSTISANSVTCLEIPTTVEKIGDYALYFYDSRSTTGVLTDVYSVAGTPAVCAGTHVFSAPTYTYATLHVPTESYDDYFSAVAWSEFFNIEAGDFTGIRSVDDTEADADCRYYSLSGQRIAAPVKGTPCIVRLGDGTMKKVLVM